MFLRSRSAAQLHSNIGPPKLPAITRLFVPINVPETLHVPSTVRGPRCGKLTQGVKFCK